MIMTQMAPVGKSHFLPESYGREMRTLATKQALPQHLL